MQRKKHLGELLKVSKKIISIFVPHRGCPHDCHFCNQKEITGVTDELSVEGLRSEIDKSLLTIKSDIVEIAFYGGSFTGLPMEVQESYLQVAYDYIIENKVQSIRLSTRPDFINETILILLKKYNVKTIELGVQSLDDEVLKKANRGTNKDDVIRASKLIKDYGFELGHQIMVGLLGDTEDTLMKTVTISIDLKPDVARIYPVLILKDTEFEKMYRNGEYPVLSLDEAVKLTAEVYREYVINNIKVLKIGLHASDTIDFDASVVAGPYHPAFRQLVETYLYKKSLLKLINDKGIDIFGKDLNVKVNSKEISNFIGINKSLKNYLLNIGVKNLNVFGQRDLESHKFELMIEDKNYISSKFFS